MLNPIYEKGKDVHVRHYLAHGHSDGKLYADTNHTVKVSSEELFNACMYGALLVHNGTDYRPVVAFSETEFKTLEDAHAMKTWTASADEEQSITTD